LPNKLLKAATFFVLFVSCVSLFAHDLYLMPVKFEIREGDILQVVLNNGDSFPESEMSPVLDRVRDVKLISATGATPVEKLRVNGKRVQGEVVIPKGESFMLVAQTVPNAFVLPPKEFNGYLKEEGLRSVIEWRKNHAATQKPGRERYSKFAKSLLSAGGSHKLHTLPSGLDIEIVPEKSPYDVKAGESLPVRVLFRSQPLADAQIETSWAGANGANRTSVVGRTDAQGRIEILLSAAGKWRIHTVWMEECPDKQVADWQSFWASLTFENEVAISALSLTKAASGGHNKNASFDDLKRYRKQTVPEWRNWQTR
jgi:uncharacterized GH25 family protein